MKQFSFNKVIFLALVAIVITAQCSFAMPTEFSPLLKMIQNGELLNEYQQNNLEQRLQDTQETFSFGQRGKIRAFIYPESSSSREDIASSEPEDGTTSPVPQSYRSLSHQKSLERQKSMNPNVPTELWEIKDTALRISKKYDKKPQMIVPIPRVDDQTSADKLVQKVREIFQETSPYQRLTRSMFIQRFLQQDKIVFQNHDFAEGVQEKVVTDFDYWLSFLHLALVDPVYPKYGVFDTKLLVKLLQLSD